MSRVSFARGCITKLALINIMVISISSCDNNRDDINVKLVAYVHLLRSLITMTKLALINMIMILISSCHNDNIDPNLTWELCEQFLRSGHNYDNDIDIIDRPITKQ